MSLVLSAPILSEKLEVTSKPQLNYQSMERVGNGHRHVSFGAACEVMAVHFLNGVEIAIFLPGSPTCVLWCRLVWHHVLTLRKELDGSAPTSQLERTNSDF